MADDDLALPVLDAIRACLCAELAASPGGETCFCGLWPALSVPADYCTCKGGVGGCGQAWVRLVRIYPYRQYPQQDVDASCRAGLAAVVELGVLRCMPSLGPNSTPPDAAAQAQAVVTQMGDWQAMRRTLECCDALVRRDVVLGNYDPRGQGGCGGGTLTATVKLGRHL